MGAGMISDLLSEPGSSSVVVAVLRTNGSKT